MKLTFAEKIAISKVIIFYPQIQLKAIDGHRSTAIKGHAFGIKTTQKELLTSLVNKLPRHDLHEVIKIHLYGKKETYAIAKKIVKDQYLNMRMEVILPWLLWLKKIGNPHFTNVEFPDKNNLKEINDAQIMLDSSLENILKNANTSESGIINKMCDKHRLNILDEQDGLHEKINGSIIRNVMITQEPTAKEPVMKILKSIQKKYIIVVKQTPKMTFHKMKKIMILIKYYKIIYQMNTLKIILFYLKLFLIFSHLD